MHSSTNSSTNVFLHLQFLLSKYFPTSHNLSHSHSQFQINSLSNIPLSINSFHSNLHLFSFHLCLMLQILAYSLHLHLQISCHFIYFVWLVLEIRLNTLRFMFLTILGKHNFAYRSLILLQLPLKLHYC